MKSGIRTDFIVLVQCFFAGLFLYFVFQLNMKISSLSKEAESEKLKQREYLAYFDSLFSEYKTTVISDTISRNRKPSLKKNKSTDIAAGKNIISTKNVSLSQSALPLYKSNPDSEKKVLSSAQKNDKVVKIGKEHQDSSSTNFSKYSATTQVNLNQYQTIVAENVELKMNLKYNADGKIIAGSVVPKLIMLEQVADIKDLKSLSFTSVARGITPERSIDFIFRESNPVDNNISELDPRNYDKQLVVELTGNLNDPYLSCNLHWVDIGGRPLKSVIRLKVN